MTKTLRTYCCLVTKPSPTLCNAMGCSPPCFSHACIHGIFLGKNTGAGCHFLLQGIFPIQELKPRLLHYRQIWVTVIIQLGFQRKQGYIPTKPVRAGILFYQLGLCNHSGSGGGIITKNTYLLLFSHSVMSNSLWPHGLQCTRLPCPSPSPRACSNLCPLNQWCHPTISSSVVPFSSCLQTFPASGYFPMSQLFASGGQSTGASASASVLPMNSQYWFPLELTGLISLQFKVLSRVISNTTAQKHQLFSTQPSLWSNSHP